MRTPFYTHQKIHVAKFENGDCASCSGDASGGGRVGGGAAASGVGVCARLLCQPSSVRDTFVCVNSDFVIGRWGMRRPMGIHRLATLADW